MNNSGSGEAKLKQISEEHKERQREKEENGREEQRKKRIQEESSATLEQLDSLKKSAGKGWFK